jgi:hypothetical protein
VAGLAERFALAEGEDLRRRHREDVRRAAGVGVGVGGLPAASRKALSATSNGQSMTAVPSTTTNQKLPGNGSGNPPPDQPALIIVIDEHAELPDPAKTVTDIRICLRVREPRDADLILGQGATAAGWHAPGRFLLSVPEHPPPSPRVPDH